MGPLTETISRHAAGFLGIESVLSVAVLIFAVLCWFSYRRFQNESAKEVTLKSLSLNVGGLSTETATNAIRRQIEMTLPTITTHLSLVLEKISKRESIDNTIESELKSLCESVNAIAGLLPEVQESLFRANQLHSRFGDIAQLIESRHSQMVALNRSWLETPYPTRIRLHNQPRNEIAERVLKGLGIHRTGSLEIELLCDHYDSFCIAAGQPYTLQNAHWEITREAAEFYLKTGILLLNIQFGSYAATFTGVLMNHYFSSIAELYKQVMPSVASSLIRELMPEVIIHELFQVFRGTERESSVPLNQIKNLGEELVKFPFKILDGGGSLHLRLGLLIELQDRRRVQERAPFGGLSRALVQPEGMSKYEWLCEHHRNEMRVKAVAPST